MTEDQKTVGRRLYDVRTGQNMRLVWARSRAQARLHVASTSITAEVASQATIVNAMMRGVHAEYAGEEAQTELPLEEDEQ